MLQPAGKKKSKICFGPVSPFVSLCLSLHDLIKDVEHHSQDHIDRFIGTCELPRQEPGEGSVVPGCIPSIFRDGRKRRRIQPLLAAARPIGGSWTKETIGSAGWLSPCLQSRAGGRNGDARQQHRAQRRHALARSRKQCSQRSTCSLSLSRSCKQCSQVCRAPLRAAPLLRSRRSSAAVARARDPDTQAAGALNEGLINPAFAAALSEALGRSGGERALLDNASASIEEERGA